ncbi:DUF3443 family protein [Ramlibacter humi]|uniref:DUF3443 family protein n=1 Tax=Ramlibacter humi TaxID=2530451 RepID=UPI00143195B7|nr:DUF3443 family protein [Ramlibacter humi]
MSGARTLPRAQRWLAAFAAGASALVIAACGGGGGGGGGDSTAPPGGAAGVDSVAAATIAGSNVVQIRVDNGTDGSAVNSPFVTVTVCAPGSATCVDIDHVVVDTGSSGLRIAASAVPAGVVLPAEPVGGGNAWECMQFASGFSWGSVRRADVKLGGEVAANLPVQVVDDPAVTGPSIPVSCRSRGFDIGAGQGAKGILGVGFATEDCPGCSLSVAPNVYFNCTGAVCNSAALSLASQVTNPVAKFASANTNGVGIVLPDVPEGGAKVATGWLIFGIGTQANNALGSASVYTADGNGNFTTTYKGATRSGFIDSGSNGLFFNDSTFPTCGDFYCPGSTTALSAVNTGLNGTTGTVNFRVESVTAIRSDAGAASIAGSVGGGLAGSFDWGLPFFFGRTVFTARSGAATPAGPGPYWAY